MEKENFNNRIFTENDLNLAKQFVSIVKEEYEEAVERNSNYLEMAFGETDSPFFKLKLEGKSFDRLKDFQFFKETVVNLAMDFLFAFKEHFNEVN